jgi:hypothetical protein
MGDELIMKVGCQVPTRGGGKLWRGIGNVNLLDWRGFDSDDTKTFPVQFPFDCCWGDVLAGHESGLGRGFAS